MLYGVFGSGRTASPAGAGVPIAAAVIPVGRPVGPVSKIDAVPMHSSAAAGSEDSHPIAHTIHTCRMKSAVILRRAWADTACDGCEGLCGNWEEG